MTNQQLLDFIKTQLLKGIDKETIIRELLGNGWSENDIQEGFNTINIPTSNSVIKTPVPQNKNARFVGKYQYIKKTAGILIILFCVYGFLELIFSMDTPLLETCIQSDTIAQDNTSGSSIKYVECMKGYITTKFNSYDRVSQRTSGYITFDKNGNYISTIPLERHSNNNFRQGTSPDFNFKDKNLFVTINDNSDTNAIPNYNSKLLSFENNKIIKVRDISFERYRIIGYENNMVYYFNHEKQSIVKENILTGEMSFVIDLNIIKRDKYYGDLYNYSFCSYKENNNLMTTFSVITAVDRETQDQTKEYYSLDLNSDKLSKIDWNGDNIVYKHCEFPNLELYPNRVKYSKIEGNASNYNLQYDLNPKMDIYKLLLFLKKGTTAKLPSVIG